MIRPMGRRQGVVLLFSIAVLALLSILAVVFATTSRMERNVSRNYVDDARAKMHANAGLEMAITALREIATSRAWDNPNEAWLFPLDPAQNTFLPQWGFALEVARRPSFMGGPALPSGAPVSGQPGQQLASTYDGGRDYYRLKVIDCASQINLNMFNIAASPSAKLVLEGMLTYLGQAIADTVPGAIDPVQSQAAALTNYRLTLPGQVFSDESQLLEALRTVFPADYQRRYGLLRDFVTTQGWTDETQVVAGNYRQAIDFPIRPSDRLDVVQRHRCPVNLNVAPQAVLVAVLTGLAGYELTQGPDNGTIMGVATMRWTKTLSTSGAAGSYISYNTAKQIAGAIVTRRNSPQGAFKTWGDFEAWVDTFNFLTLQQRAVVKSNANPNMRFNKFNPNDVVYSRIDKIDLGYYPGGTGAQPQKGGTTEFCFSSMGYFEIESLGRVSRFEGNVERIQASKVLFAVVQVYNAVRLTSQKDFLDNLQGAVRARSYPESLDERTYGGERGDESVAGANPNDGQIAIGTEWDTGARAGQTWYHSFENEFRSTSPALSPIVNELQKHETGGAAWGGNLSVQDGNDLVPDGVLNWRLPGGDGEELNFRMTPAVVGDGAAALQGSTEMWIKLGSDPTQGSNEVLCYAVKELAANVPAPGQHWGLAWKLERFGTRIRSTRFLYGFPDRETLAPAFRAPGVLAPGGAVTFAYTEVDFMATAWKAHEWHRVTHSWWNGTEQSMTIDGQTSFGMTFTLVRESAVDVGARFDFGPGQVFQRTVNGYRLITLDWDQRFQVGGYSFQYQNPRASTMAVYNQQWSVRNGQVLLRYPNATIDEMRFTSSQAVPGSRDRYGIQNGSSWRGTIPAAKLGGGRLGTVSYTIYYPKGYGSRSFSPQQLRIGFSAGYQSKGMQQAPAPQGLAIDGEGWGVYPAANKGIPAGEDFSFRIDFRNPGGITPLNVTPVFDDVTATAMAAPKFLEYSWLTRPDPQ